MADSAAKARAHSPKTKDAIRAAAEVLFAQHGFGDTSVRDIAKAAGVDPALVIRHFGSKELLFVTTMSIEGGFEALTSAALTDVGREIVRQLIAGRAEAAPRFYVSLMRAMDRPEVRAYALRATSAAIVDPLATRLAGPDARLRARLVAAQITGLLNGLWILEDLELVGAPSDAVIELYGGAIQTLIDGP